MIAHLNGTVARTSAGVVVVDVQGVGYRVSVPVSVLETLPALGESVLLIIHTIVREDDISLYGFADELDMRVFELLLSVSGIGPKAALGLLSALSAADLASAVASEEVRTLTRVPGIGTKTAQRMVLELKEKFAQLGLERRAGLFASGVPQPAAPASVADDVVSALVNLGYTKAEAQRATDAEVEVRASRGEDAGEFAALLRATLNRLTGK